jgi:hypothetical protein
MRRIIRREGTIDSTVLLKQCGHLNTPEPRLRLHALIPAALIAVTLVVYLISMPLPMPDSDDAVVEVNLAIRSDGATVFRPNHLLLTPTNHLVLRLARWLKQDIAVHIPLQALNAAAGAACAGLTLLIYRRLRVPWLLASMSSAMLAFAYAPWLHSREAESAIVSQAFMLLGLYFTLLLPGHRDRGTAFTVMLAAWAAATSVLFSFNYLLLVPAFALGVALLSERGTRMVHLAAFSVVAGSVIGISYVSAAYYTIGRIHPIEILSWVTHHPSSPMLSFTGTLSLDNFLRAGTGLANYFVGYSAVPTWIKMTMRGDVPIALSTADVIRSTVGIAASAIFLWGFLTVPRSSVERVICALCTAAVLPMFLFLVLWLGSDPQFWLPVVPFLAMRLTVASARFESPRMRGLPIVPSLLIVTSVLINLPYPVPTATCRRGGVDWERAARYSRLADEGDLLLYVRGWPRYLGPYGRHNTLSLIYGVAGRGLPFAEDVTAAIDAAIEMGADVYALDIFEVYSQTAVGAWEEVETLSGLQRSEILARVLRSYETRVVEEAAFGRTLMQVRKRSPPGTVTDRGLFGSPSIALTCASPIVPKGGEEGMQNPVCPRRKVSSAAGLLEEHDPGSECVFDHLDGNVPGLRQMGEQLLLRIAEMGGNLVVFEVDPLDTPQYCGRGREQRLIFAPFDVHLQQIQSVDLEFIERSLERSTGGPSRARRLKIRGGSVPVELDLVAAAPHLAPQQLAPARVPRQSDLCGDDATSQPVDLEVVGESLERRRPGLKAENACAWGDMRGPNSEQADVRTGVEYEAVLRVDVIARSKEDIPENLDLLPALDAKANAIAQHQVVWERLLRESQVPQRQMQPVSGTPVSGDDLRKAAKVFQVPSRLADVHLRPHLSEGSGVGPLPEAPRVDTGEGVPEYTTTPGAEPNPARATAGGQLPAHRLSCHAGAPFAGAQG